MRVEHHMGRIALLSAPIWPLSSFAFLVRLSLTLAAPYQHPLVVSRKARCVRNETRRLVEMAWSQAFGK